MKTVKILKGTKIIIEAPGGWKQSFVCKSDSVLTLGAPSASKRTNSKKKKTTSKKNGSQSWVVGFFVLIVIFLYLMLNSG